MQLIGIPLAIALGLIFWVGSQTFVDPGERLLAQMIWPACLALLVTSIGSLFVPGWRRLNRWITIAAMLFAATLWAFLR